VNASDAVTILIPAVGGQGGGVLSEWIVEAAVAAGCRAHGTSIPGVAQRTGSTSYYVEVFADGAGDEPVVSLYPVPGALDVLLAPEFLEVGRAIELGFPSPARTTIIASTHRLYSIHEKIVTGTGTYPREALEAAARAMSRRLVAFDALALAREHRTEANAVLLGALSASGVVPIPPAAFRRAIEAKGVQVAANLKGFDVGYETALRGTPHAPADARTAPADGETSRLAPPSPAAGAVAAEIARFPSALQATLDHALPRLVDYQDAAYAARYLDRLRPFAAPGADLEVARLVARNLAVWMTYEDAIRVADLKTRAGRFARIRREAGGANSHVVVVDYLKPDLDEIYGILPHRLVAPFARWAERRWPHGRPTLGQRVKTTTITGFLRVWLLARLRRLRPLSYRARLEHARMERWLAAVGQAAAWDRGLAIEIARAAGLVKGYGDVRRRLSALVDDLLAQGMRAAALDAAASDFAISTALVRRYHELVLAGPESEAGAAALAAETVRCLTAGDRAAARALLGLSAPAPTAR
jgi:indolepyruvate ferredoxin oxidoreductase beta subunit